MSRRAIAAFLLASLLVAAPAPASKLTPVDLRAPVEIEVGGRTYLYFPLTAEQPLAVEVEGPSRFEAIVRGRFVERTDPVSVEIDVLMDGRPLWTTVLTAEPGSSRYTAHPEWGVGRPDRIAVDVPAGAHAVELRLVRPVDGVVDVNPVRRALDVLPWRLAWRGSLGATYDSNVCRYSDEDRDEYLDGLRPDRYPMHALDDLRLEPGAAVDLISEEPGRRRTSLRLSGALLLNTVNGEKSFARLSARLLETRPGVAYLRAEYAIVPSYRIRPLWDEDVGDYRACDYRKDAVSLEIGSDRSLPVDVRATWDHEVYRYDQDFLEYDADANTFGVRLVARPLRGLRLDAGYELRRSVARGADEVGESRATSDDSDATYDEDAWELRARWSARRMEHGTLVLTGRVRRAERFFLTEKDPGDDPYHRGREDRFWTVRLGAEAPLRPDIVVEGFAEFRSRATNSDVVDEIGGVKDYTDFRLGAGIIVEGVRFLD